jgi:hypothetical protein
VDSAVLFIKPDSDRPFEFSIRPQWALTQSHDLAVTVNGKQSVIGGVISDRNSAFRFNFVDKLEVIEKFSLLFKGEWRQDAASGDPARLVYEYDIADCPKGRFELPNKLSIDNNSNVLAYSYKKEGRTRSVQLVGQFQYNNFELSYGIERKSSAEGRSTTLKFAVDVTGATSDGKVTFELKKQDGLSSGTTLAIDGNYSARFDDGTLTLAFGFRQQTAAGTVAVRELTFGGQLQQKGGTAFTWELAMGGGVTNIAIAANQIRLGPVTADTKVKVAIQGGSVQGVQMLLGLSF